MQKLPDTGKYYIAYKNSIQGKQCGSMRPKRSQAAADSADAKLSSLLRDVVPRKDNSAAAKDSDRFL